MQTPTNINNQQVWGGQSYPLGSSADTVGPQAQHTLLPRERQEPRFRPSSQAGFIASDSDDLFHPAPGGPSSRVFHLPDVPLPPHPRFRAYSQSSNTLHSRPLPHPSAFTSYNNPSFAIPPPLPRPTYHTPPPLPQDARGHLEPSPPIDPHVHPTSVRNTPRPLHTPIAQPTLTQPTCHHHCTSNSSPSSKTLPSVTHIPLLTSKSDFSAWDEGVTTLLRANGLFGHILDPSEPMTLSQPRRIPSPPPVLPHRPLPEELDVYNLWWDRDNIAQHILLSRLGSVPRGLLPSPNVVTRTALSVYRRLVEYYGTSSFADCTELLHSLHNAVCTHGRVQEYVSKWRTGISRLQSARFSFNVKTCISFFVRGLPLIAAFTSLRSDLPDRLAAMLDDDLGAFVEVTERVLQLDTIFRMASQAQAPRSQRTPSLQPSPSPSTAPSSSAPPLPPVPDPPRSSKSSLSCGNCKSRGLRYLGHTDGTCFQPGGGMEGRREEYLNNKGRIHALFAECLDNAGVA